MKTRHLFIALAVGLGLAVGLLYLLDGQTSPVTAAPACQPLAPASAVITVCASGCDYAGIQNAVDAAGNGDEIKVAGGTYTGVNVRPAPHGYDGSDPVTQLVYISKTITLRGGYTTTNWTTPDPDANPTILNAQGLGRGIFIAGSISPTVEGLRITDGAATLLGGGPSGVDAGGGVYVISATAVISDNQVFDNTTGGANGWGGGIYLNTSPATLNGNSIFSNTGGYSGGGIQLYLSAATVRGNTVLSNIADFGGGMNLWFSDNAVVSGNTIRANTVITSGGGLYVHESAATLNGNTAISNTAGWGGGLFLYRGSVAVSGNTIATNTSHSDGGGLYVYDSAATLSGNDVLSNTAGYAGGGLLLYLSPATLSGNAVAFNIACFGGGGFLWASDNATLNQNAISYNTVISQGGGLVMDSSTAALDSNIFRGNTADAAGGLYLHQSDTTLVNNVVIENRGISEGGGMILYDDASQLLHTTIHDNSGGDGSGVYVGSGSSVMLINTILVSQTVGITVAEGSAATLDGVLWYSNGANTDGTGTIFATSEVTGAPRFADDGYHLTAGSAAANAGVDSWVNSDIDGQSRHYSIPDLGADELGAERTIDPATGGTLVFTDTQGYSTTVEVAPGAVTRTAILVFTPVITPGYPLSPGMQFAGHAFDLEAYCISRLYLPLVLRNQSASAAAAADGPALAGTSSASSFAPCSLALQIPVTITVYYNDQDVQGIDEDSLRLDRWMGTYWEDDANTCIPASTYVTDTVGNMLQVPVCSLSRHSMRGR